MGLGKTLYLFCEVGGTVLADGRPLAGAEVERSWFWGFKEQRGRETVTTDAQGRFRFAEHSESSLLGGLLPHEALVTQKIVIRHDGREYEAWMNTRRDYERNSELDGRPAELVCALETPAGAWGGVYGICRPVTR